jgi:hypothetical protein
LAETLSARSLLIGSPNFNNRLQEEEKAMTIKDLVTSATLVAALGLATASSQVVAMEGMSGMSGMSGMDSMSGMTGMEGDKKKDEKKEEKK